MLGDFRFQKVNELTKVPKRSGKFYYHRVWDNQDLFYLADTSETVILFSFDVKGRFISQRTVCLSYLLAPFQTTTACEKLE